MRGRLLKRLNLNSLEQSLPSGTFDSILFEEFSEIVPKIFNLPNTPVTAEELEECRTALLAPMEEFICCGNPLEYLQESANRGKQSYLCGKVFKNGEPTYSCRDCASDPTCVFCNECFHNSCHIKHRYRMSTSQGGGFCDCGDEEAWKMSPRCSLHSQSPLDESAIKAAMDALPTVTHARTVALLRATLHYSYHLLIWQEPTEMPSFLNYDDTPELFCTMLFNDESHTYDEVIGSLKKAVGASTSEATAFAAVVDREGRSCVRHGAFKDCEASRITITRSTSRHGISPLKTQTMDVRVVAHQTFATLLVKWYCDFICSSEGFRLLLCEELFNIKCLPSAIIASTPIQEFPLVESLLLSDTSLWKACRVQWHNLFTQSVFMDSGNKREFALSFVRHYESMLSAFFADDHDHSVSATSLSVQLFTVTTIAHRLVADHSVLSRVLRATTCGLYDSNDKLLDIIPRATQTTIPRYHYGFNDLRYLLLKPPASWDENLTESFINFFDLFVKFASSFQYYKEMIRQTGQHIEMEPEWEGSFYLQNSLTSVVSLLVHWCSSNRRVLRESYKITFASLTDFMRRTPLPLVAITLGPQTTEVFEYSVSTQPVSFNIPLNRLASTLLLHSSVSSSPFPLEREESLLLIEAPLRLLVTDSQIHAAMWRRNGISLLNQQFLYHYARRRSETYDRDVLAIQIGAATLPPDDFLIAVVNRFQLVSWFTADDAVLEHHLQCTTTMVEELFFLLIVVLSERFTVGLGDVTDNECVRHEVVHHLCKANLSHGDLVKLMPEHRVTEESDSFEEVIDSVAVFKRASSTSKGLYELKPEFLSEFNAFYYHFTRAEMSDSEEVMRKKRKLCDSSSHPGPPRFPQLRPAFESLVRLLDSDVFIFLVSEVVGRGGARRPTSDGIIYRALHLIGIALQEERRLFSSRESSGLNFVEKSTRGEPSLVELLRRLVAVSTGKHYLELLSWVNRTFAEVKKSKFPDAQCELPDFHNQSEVNSEKEKEAKEKAKRRRERIVANMGRMQKEFMNQNKMPPEMKTSLVNDNHSGSGCSSGYNEPIASTSSVQKPNKPNSMINQDHMVTCLLCQEEENLLSTDRAIVVPVFIQPSNVLLSQTSLRSQDTFREDWLLRSDLGYGTHMSSCQHTMHWNCWEKYFLATQQSREQRRRRMSLSYSISDKEFLCPLCKSIGNAVMPIVTMEDITPISPPMECDELDITYSDWLDLIYKNTTDPKEFPEETIPPGSVGSRFSRIYEDVETGHLTQSHVAMVARLSQACHKVSLKYNANQRKVILLGDSVNDRAICLWKCCAFSVQSFYSYILSEGIQLADCSQDRQYQGLVNLIRCSRAILSQCKALELRRFYGCVLDTCIYKKWEYDVLDFDLFGYLVLLLFLSHGVSRSGAAENGVASVCIHGSGINQTYTIRSVFQIYVVQCLLTVLYEPKCMRNADPIPDLDSENSLVVASVVERLVRDYGCPSRDIDNSQLYLHLIISSLPFLKCAALFLHFFNGTPLPSANPDGLESEFNGLCAYLSIPSRLSIILADFPDSPLGVTVTPWSRLVTRWFREVPMLTYPLSSRRLVELPDDFSELIALAAEFSCPSSSDTRNPAMCLICGEMVCSQSYCCQTELDGERVGGCVAHASRCGLNVGVFLRVRQCQVLLLTGFSGRRRTTGAFYLAPYVDAYGEVDPELSRGNPLQLNRDLYARLQRMWLSHGVPMEIHRRIEASSNILFEWQHV